MAKVFKLVNHREVIGWDKFVETHPHGQIHHTTSMIRTYESTVGYEPLAMAAVDESGCIYGILVSVRICTLHRWARSFAARAVMFAEPIYQSNYFGHLAAKSLIQEHDRIMRKRVLFTEVRPAFDAPIHYDPLLENDYQKLGYVNYKANLLRGENALWASLQAGCRSDIRRSQKRGLVVRLANRGACLSDMYEMLKITYSRSKVPLADESLFASVFEHFSEEQCTMFVAEYENRPVAFGLFLAYGDRVTYWYGGAHRIPGVSGPSVLLWEAMRYYASRGFAVFDFGGAGWEGEDYGPGKFKSQFGGELTRFGRYRRVNSHWKMRLAERGYSILRRVVAPKVDHRKQDFSSTRSERG